MKKRVCYRAIIEAMVLLGLSICGQRASYMMAALWFDVETYRKLVENTSGALFSLAVMMALGIKVHWWSRRLYRQSYLLLLPASYMLLNLIGNDIVLRDGPIMVAGIGANALTGFLEELLLRGCILILLVRALPSGSWLQAVLMSSLLFGLAHWANLLNDGVSWAMALAQVTYAFFIGVGFAAVYVRTQALIPLIIIHSGINMVDFLTDNGSSEPVTAWIELLPAILICLPLLLFGLFILRASKQSQITWQFGTEKITQGTL